MRTPSTRLGCDCTVHRRSPRNPTKEVPWKRADMPEHRKGLGWSRTRMVVPSPDQSLQKGPQPGRPQLARLPLPSRLFRERAGFCEGGEAAGRRLWQEHRKHSWLILFPAGDGAGAAQDTGDAASALEKLTVFLKRQVWSRKEHSLGVQVGWSLSRTLYGVSTYIGHVMAISLV